MNKTGSDTIKGRQRERSADRLEYFSDGYFSQRQWMSYAFQVRTMYRLFGESKAEVLEIGCGTGFVNAMLNSLGYDTETMDINSNLNPDHVGDISSQDIKLNKGFDAVLCAEVLEHLPFECFDTCLKNIWELTRRFAVITLPDCLYRVHVSLQVNSREYSWRLMKGLKCTYEMHCWEINSGRDTSEYEVSRHIRQHFSVLDEGLVKGNDFQRFYILERK